MQTELETLSQDKEHGEFLREHLKNPPSGPPSLSAQRGLMTPSIANRYQSFYASQLRNMKARHILSRYAAEGLIAHLDNGKNEDADARKDSSGSGVESSDESDAAIIELARQVVSKLNEIQDISVSEEPTKEVSQTAQGSTTVIYNGMAADDRRMSPVAPLQCAAALGALASRAETAGRLIVRSSGVQEDRVTQVCGLVLSLGGLGTVPAELAADLEKEFVTTACAVLDALDTVLAGKSRNSICVVHSTDVNGQHTETEAIEGDKKVRKDPLSLSLSSVVGAVLQARTQYLWFSKVAIVDVFGLFERPCAAMKGMGVQFFSVSIAPDLRKEGSASAQAAQVRNDAGDQECNAWRAALEAVAVQVAEFVPELIIACIRCSNVGQAVGSRDADKSRHSLLPRKLSSEEWGMAAKRLEKLATQVCGGRLVVVWDLIGGSQLWHGSVTDFTVGLL